MKNIRGKLKKGGKWLLITSGGLFLLFLLLQWWFPLPDRVEYSTIITDHKGEVIHAYLTRDEKWRMKTYLEEISPCYAKPL
ncbi:hypothetical protein [Paraflavitalea speifideaquila]|uniref:hypothetical protein n=1 Tax=Paraflavitalea speifideaquila TaxID=3076558 RepID=UPI0028E5CB7F|nr:hypothetical protein [Paraflavitalea speifideiaquila]